MLEYLLLAFGFFSGVWFLRSFRSEFYKIARNTLSLLNHLLDDVNEEMKVQRVQKSTLSVIVSLGSVIILVTVAIAVSLFPYWLSTSRIYGFGQVMPSSFWQIVAISIGASIPFFITLKKNDNGYSELSQLLHHLILDNYAIGLKLFKREVKQREKKGVGLKNEFVIITGLARAGTTSLMNHLVSIDRFKSLSYADMPLLLAPNTWAKFYKPKKHELKERSHQDGIKIGLESNEALEEYFFKAVDKDRFIDEKVLKEYELGEKQYQKYLEYQTLVRQSDNDIYLAKNNNFLLRYSSIRALNPHFVVVIMLREPLAHATSLLEKHEQYCEMQENDTFVLEYMNWLGHHEFGLNQKAFDFGTPLPKGDKMKVDYWLKVWINYYNEVQKIKDSKCLIVCYESYCANPNKTVNSVLKAIDINVEVGPFQPFENKRKTTGSYTDSLYIEAQALYENLKERHLK